MTYSAENPLTVVELFAGYGSQRMALERLKRDFPPFDFKVLAFAEIDRYALAAYEAVHGDCPNLGSVTDIDWAEHPELKGLGLLTYSFPCQDISTAGKQRGFEKGSNTRSGLLWECERAISVLRPKYLLMENVAAIMQKKFLPNFREWQECLEGYGYTNFTALLNSKDFGCPQNRLRCFMVSILGEASFEFPKPFPLEKQLRDVLEENVDESYYLKDEQVRRILALCDRKQAEGCGFKTQFTTPDKVCGTIMSNYGQRETDPYVKIDKAMIPINTASDGCASAITAHYHKCGASDFRPHGVDGNHMSNTAVLKVTEDPKVMQIGSYSPSSACNAKVLDTDGICPTLLDHKGAKPAIVEPLSCAMRGRNPNNPSDRTAGINTEQRLEIGSDVANCVTTVQKDSMVIEPSILTPIRTEKAKELRRQGVETFANRELVPRTDGCSGTITTVQKDNLLREPCQVIGSTQANAYRGSVDGVAPCVNAAAGMGGGHVPMVTEEPQILQYGHGYNPGGLRGDICPTITTSSFEHNNHVLEPKIIGYSRSSEGSGKVVGYHTKDTANTLHTSTGSGGNTDQFVKEAISRKDDVVFKKMPDGNIHAFRASDPKKSTAPEWQITNADNVHPTITTSHEPKVLLKYRIRKLTPTECFRLMGCEDSDIDKLKSAKLTQHLKSGKVKEKPMPKTQLYKMAGNSIVVDVLYHIFHQMFVAEPPKPQSRQLTLFD